jgi:hypothetical protein
MSNESSMLVSTRNDESSMAVLDVPMSNVSESSKRDAAGTFEFTVGSVCALRGGVLDSISPIPISNAMSSPSSAKSAAAPCDIGFGIDCMATSSPPNSSTSVSVGTANAMASASLSKRAAGWAAGEAGAGGAEAGVGAGGGAKDGASSAAGFGAS